MWDMIAIISNILFIYLSDDTGLYVRKDVGKWQQPTDIKLVDFEDTNNDLQNTTQKTNDRATRTPQKTAVIPGVPEGLAVPAQLLTPIVLLLNDTDII